MFHVTAARIFIHPVLVKYLFTMVQFAICISKIAKTRFSLRRPMYEVGITGTVACKYPRLGSGFTAYVSEKPNTTKEYRPIAKFSGTYWEKFYIHKIFFSWRIPKNLYIKFFYQCSKIPSHCMQMIIKPIPSHMIFQSGTLTQFFNLGTFDVTGKSSFQGTCLRMTKF
uniref:Secreted protein n=1 Tax=Strongyloides papillosus TaxID=174720 RepID=A0A0N5C517_STREA